MTNEKLAFTKPNQAWILFREEIHTEQNGICNVYILLDAYSQYLFGMEASVDLPTTLKVKELLQKAQTKARTWPQQILALKKDPFAEPFQEICNGQMIPLRELTAKEMQPLIQGFRNSFRQFKLGNPRVEDDIPMTEIDEAELESFVPDTYSPCPCASGKKFKEAKDAWEKGLVLLPTDQMTKSNLYEFIYNNPIIPSDLKKVSPFIEKFLSK